MHIIELKKKKRESFSKDFRRSTIHAFTFTKPVDSEIEGTLCNLGLTKDQDWVYKDSELEFYITKDTFLLVYRSGVLERDCRISKSERIIKEILPQMTGNTLESVCITHENRYVLSPFENNETQRYNALKFFFENIFDEQNDMEPVAKDDKNEIITSLRIQFKEQDNDTMFLDSTIYSGTTMNNKSLNKSLLNKLESWGYCLWRNTVSKNVISEMKK